MECIILDLKHDIAITTNYQLHDYIYDDSLSKGQRVSTSWIVYINRSINKLFVA